MPTCWGAAASISPDFICLKESYRPPFPSFHPRMAAFCSWLPATSRAVLNAALCATALRSRGSFCSVFTSSLAICISSAMGNSCVFFFDHGRDVGRHAIFQLTTRWILIVAYVTSRNISMNCEENPAFATTIWAPFIPLSDRKASVSILHGWQIRSPMCRRLS